MKKAVIYSRVSTTEQDYTSQTSDLKKKAESMAMKLPISMKKKNQALMMIELNWLRC